MSDRPRFLPSSYVVSLPDSLPPINHPVHAKSSAKSRYGWRREWGGLVPLYIFQQCKYNLVLYQYCHELLQIAAICFLAQIAPELKMPSQKLQSTYEGASIDSDGDIHCKCGFNMRSSEVRDSKKKVPILGESVSQYLSNTNYLNHQNSCAKIRHAKRV